MSAPDEATGSRGEVEALARLLRRPGDDWSDVMDFARWLLASDWLAQRDAAQRAEALRCRCTAQGGGVYDAECPRHAGMQDALAVAQREAAQAVLDAVEGVANLLGYSYDSAQYIAAARAAAARFGVTR